MELFLTLSVLCAAFSLVFPAIGHLTTRNNKSGYICEAKFISDDEVSYAVREHKKSLASKQFTPLSFPDIPDNEDLDLRIHQILKPEVLVASNSHHKGYYIIHRTKLPISFESVTGVFILAWNDDKIPCVRINVSPPSSPQRYSYPSLSEPFDRVSGFQCGLGFVSKDTINYSLFLAQKNLPGGIDGLTRYARPEGQYVLWPLVDTTPFHEVERNIELNSIYLVVGNDGSYIKVVYRLLNGNYVDCQSVAKSARNTPIPSTRTKNDEISNEGYACEMFFDMKYIFASRFAAFLSEKTKFVVSTRKGYPKPFEGKGVDGEILLWPLSFSKMIYTTGTSTYLFLLLSKNFTIIGMVMKGDENKYKVCKELSFRKDMIAETCDFNCFGQRINNQKLSTMAKDACDDIPDKASYPRIYEGPRFKLPGPYLVAPSRKDRLKRKTILVAITYNCLIAGVLELHDKTLQRCSRWNEEKKDTPPPNKIQMFLRVLAYASRSKISKSAKTKRINP